MPFKEFTKDLKSQAACTKRLCKATKSQDEGNTEGSGGHDENETVDAFIFDSWFASVQGGLALQKEGYEFCGIVKMSHSGSPKSQVEALMEDMTGGTYIVLVSDDLVFTGYKYNSRKVICAISSKNFQTTRPGDPYIARWADETNTSKSCEVLRPTHLSKYFRHCNAIDVHNHSRQGNLALEEKWQTQCCWFRLVTFFTGLTVTDMWRATKKGVPANNWLNKIPLRKFAEIVAMEMLDNKLSHDNYGGKPVSQVPLRAPVAASNLAANGHAFAPGNAPSASETNLDEDGFIQNFAKMRVGADGAVGRRFGPNKEWVCAHNPKGHIIVLTDKWQRCHVCTVTKGSTKAVRSKYLCFTCDKPVCLNEKGGFCMDIHALCNPDILKNGTKDRRAVETRRAVDVHTRYQNPQIVMEERLASTV